MKKIILFTLYIISLSINAKEPSYVEQSEINEQANYYSEKASDHYNPELAKFLYLKAAKNNYYLPFYNYYIVCKEQEEAHCDIERAIGYLKIAAENNISDAQNEMGSLYWNGVWRKKDVDKSIYWYKKSAKNNNTYGYYNTGRILYIIKKKTTESRFYLEAASKANFIPAKDLYARYLLENGNHGSDDILAVKLLKGNVKHDYYLSYYRLALCYIYSVGVDQNLEYAESLLESAKLGGVEEASHWLDRVRVGEFN
ncbi:tetratricopeptide repeat protein [Vibrio splendidus]